MASLIYKQKSTTSKRRAIVAEAAEWLETPYQHQAMVKHEGVDCAMLVVGVALNCGLITKEDVKKVPNYSREWHMHQDIPLIQQIMESFGCKQKKGDTIRPGDIVIFKMGRVPSHLGIVCEEEEPYIIHAYAGSIQKVTANQLAGKWIDRVSGIYTFPGVK